MLSRGCRADVCGYRKGEKTNQTGAIPGEGVASTYRDRRPAGAVRTMAAKLFTLL